MSSLQDLLMTFAAFILVLGLFAFFFFFGIYYPELLIGFLSGVLFSLVIANWRTYRNMIQKFIG
jgi:cellobiose-specific phosphotransferase system component IIC